MINRYQSRDGLQKSSCYKTMDFTITGLFATAASAWLNQLTGVLIGIPVLEIIC